MGEETAAIDMGEDRSDDETEIESDFEFDEEIKQSLNSLLNVPLEFIEGTSDEEEEPKLEVKRPEPEKRDSVERQLEELFVGDRHVPGEGSKDTASSKDTGLENISDNEFDGPESGECDTSDGELPDSPSVVVTLTNIPSGMSSKITGVDDVSLDGESDVEIMEEYHKRNREYFDTVSQKITVSKPDREVIIESRVEPEILKSKDKKDRDSHKAKEKSGEKSKNKDKKEKKDKFKKKSESGVTHDELKKKLKLKKYLARLDQYRTKCLEYMGQISKKCDIIQKGEKHKIKSDANKNTVVVGGGAKIKSVVEKIGKEREISPHSSTSSKFDQVSSSSHSSKLEKMSHSFTTDELIKPRSTSSEKERKSKTDKKLKIKSKELKEHKLKYQKYIQYLQAERAKCYEDRVALDKHKNKSKRKHRKSESSSPDKSKEKTSVFERKESRPPVLSFAQFCTSRELISPEKEMLKTPVEKLVISSSEERKGRTISVDSQATTSTAQSDHVDDDKELFITYSDLVEQDKMKENKKLEEDRENIENILEKDPELKSISVFTSVLFKGSADSIGIPFLQEGRPPSPNVESFKPKPTFTQSTGPDEIYDWNDDLSTISQSSLSPSRSPVPKVHNKALLNFLENQKDPHTSRKTKVSLKKSSKSSRSRSKSPKKEKSKKRKMKHHSSISVSPSPPPLKPRSPDIYKKWSSPPAYLKERWRDYPSPPERRRENYERPNRSRRRSRSRTRPRVNHHRSRSSSEEERHYRRYRSRSHSRSPPPPAMVQFSASDKRRKLKEEHERALASLRATIRKPMLSNTPLSITFTTDGDNFEPIRDNYDPVVMNEVCARRSYMKGSDWKQLLPTNGCYSHFPGSMAHNPQPHPHLRSSEMTPHYYYYPSYHQY